MATYFMAPAVNYLTKTLSGGISDSVDTITLNNTTNMLAPGYIVVDRTNSSGTATPDSREVIYYTGISGSDLTGCSRGADGSTARTHNDGALVETMPTVGMWNSLTTIVSTALDSNSYLKAINSPVSIARGEITQMAVPSSASIARAEVRYGEITQMATSSIASIARITTPLIMASTAQASVLTVLGHISVSGASVTGVFPALTKTRSIWVPAVAFMTASGSPALTDVDDVLAYWALDGAGTEIVSSSFVLPLDYASGDVSAYVYWISLTTNTGNIVFRIRNAGFVAEDGAAGGATGNSDFTEAAIATVGDLNISAAQTLSGTPGAGKLFPIGVGRVGGDGADTLTGDIGFVGLRVDYLSSQ